MECGARFIEGKANTEMACPGINHGLPVPGQVGLPRTAQEGIVGMLWVKPNSAPTSYSPMILIILIS